MTTIGWPREFDLAPEKITAYLLDPDHPDGGAKAKFFLLFGFDRTSPSQRGFALLKHAVLEHFVREVISPRGDVKFVCEGPLHTPDGRHPWIRSVWQIDPQMRGRFVTAYPVPAPGGL